MFPWLGPALFGSLTINPSAVTLLTGQFQTFSASGGTAPYVFSITVNNSGGTINASTGVYQAGPTGSVSDTVRVTDANSNHADATVTVNALAGRVLIAQPVAVGSNSGVKLTAVGVHSGSLTQASTTLSSVECGGPVAFLTNDLPNHYDYLAVLSNDGSDQFLFVYEINDLQVQHQYSSGVEVNNSNFLDSITGYAFAGTDGVDVCLSYTLLTTPNSAFADGPPNDPQARQTFVVTIDRSDELTNVRTDNATAQVSRAFAIDGEYYAWHYYQSGSGNTIAPATVSYATSLGDTFIGAPTQPITVGPGDFVTGSPGAYVVNNTTGNGLYPSAAVSSKNVQSGDTVANTTASGLFSFFGIPDGSPILKWTVTNMPSTTGTIGGRMVVAGTSDSSANATFDVWGSLGGIVYTAPYSTTNGTVANATFTTAGTFTINSLTGYSIPTFNTSTQALYTPGGHITVTGSSTGDVTNAFIDRISPGGVNAGTFGNIGTAGPVVWVATSTQTETNSPNFTAAFSTVLTDTWVFQTGEFGGSELTANLVVTGDQVNPGNNGTFTIDAASRQALGTSTASGLIAEFFTPPYPTASVQLTTQVPYTFSLPGLGVPLDYTFIGATMVVTDSDNPNNDGAYIINQITVDPNTGLQRIQTTPAVMTGEQTNEDYGTFTTAFINFTKASTVAAEFQPTWFLKPLFGTQPVVGRADYALAYSDWRLEGDTVHGPNLYPMSLSSVVDGAVALPYRAQNVTSSVPEVVNNAQIPVVNTILASTVGLKTFTISSGLAQSQVAAGELTIGGPMATVFTPSGFLESGVNLAPEQPWLVSQSVNGATGALALTPSATYYYVVTFEGTDESGNRIYSPPSPPLKVVMSYANDEGALQPANVVTIGGDLIYPLDTSGNPIPGTFGPTTRDVTLSIYRTAVSADGTTTTEHFKITDDLNVNGLAPISSTNPSGFSFIDGGLRWTYLDQNPDVEIQANEVLYTDKGYLPRYPLPPFRSGVASWLQREWVIADDGSIGFTGQKTEGDALWSHPGFRVVLPTDDEPIAIAEMEDYLVICCSASMWYLPATNNLPDATGAGVIPNPVRMPFNNGSINGFAETVRVGNQVAGVAYDSTAGGVWMIDRSLQNVWLSEPVQDSLTGTILGMAVDGRQRLSVLQASDFGKQVLVYDGVPNAWYVWNVDDALELVTDYQGQVTVQGSWVSTQVIGQKYDNIGGAVTGIQPYYEIAPLNLGNVRGLKRVWTLQVVGKYLGPHNLNVTIAYPESDAPTTTCEPFTPDPSKPYVYSVFPIVQAGSEYLVTVTCDFDDVETPGLSFALEALAAEVGVIQSGLNKQPASARIKN